MTVAESGGIFVSYRRQESSHLAGRLYDRLTDRFGEGQVFIDVETIEPGVDFAEAISRAVATCQVLLAVIGPGWLTATDERGRRRLDDPEDIVRLEIEAALVRDVRVIPILVEGAVMPGREDLPESLAGLARRNAFPIRHERFKGDARFLFTVIERVLAAAPAATAVPRAPDAPPPHQETSTAKQQGPQATVVPRSPTDVRSVTASSKQLDTFFTDLPRLYRDSTEESRISLTTVGHPAHPSLESFIDHAHAVADALSGLCTFLEENSRPVDPAEISDHMMQEMNTLWDIRERILGDLKFYENESIIMSLSRKGGSASVIETCIDELNSIRVIVKDTLGDNVRAAWRDLSNKHVSARQQQESRAVAVRSLRSLAEKWLTFSEMLSTAQSLLNQDDFA